FLAERQVADYGAFQAAVARIAGALRNGGIGPGDRVVIFMKNVPEYLIAQYGIWYAGAAAVPVNAKLHGRELAWIAQDAGVALVFATSDLAADLADVGLECPVIDVGGADYAAMLKVDPVAEPAYRADSDLAWLFYTSGTTGKPKGVMITHGMLIAMSLSYQVDADLVRGEDAALYAAPLSHGAGIYNMMHVQAGARHVFPASGGFDPKEIFDLARHFGSVHMFAAPTMVKRLTEAAKAAGETGEGLRTVVYAGGPMYLADIIAAVEVFGPVFVQIYGQGECPMSITALGRRDIADRTHPRWRERLASVGRAQSVCEVRIGDANGQALLPGEAGEIMVRGQTVMPGYWRNEAATAKTVVDGWLWTGDVGHMDAEGYVTMQDRSKDLIISGGTNIYPREVEEALMTHPGVAEVSVVGRPNAEWGEDVVAFVVRAAGTAVSEADLDAHCLSQIARFKRPKAYFWLPELPKNNYGKVLKTELRERIAEDQT
ncbi:MAG: AMP-binding protein, partial [Paracoccaceae bacterium]